jgi:hypothetical protein
LRTPLLTKGQVIGEFKLTIGSKKSANLLTNTLLPFSARNALINLQGSNGVSVRLARERRTSLLGIALIRQTAATETRKA